MATLAEVRTAVKTTLSAAVPDLHAYDRAPEVALLPAVVVLPDESNFDVAMGKGVDTYQFNLAVLAPSGDAVVGQDILDAYVSGAGAKSIRSAIFAARSLGLANTDAHVASMDRYGMSLEVVGLPHVGAMLQLIVHTKGT